MTSKCSTILTRDQKADGRQRRQPGRLPHAAIVSHFNCTRRAIDEAVKNCPLPVYVHPDASLPWPRKLTLNEEHAVLWLLSGRGTREQRDKLVMQADFRVRFARPW